jgi:hypothetical protein
MVGTTRFELATSSTPILETTQSEQLSYIHQYIGERKATRHNAYWTRNGPIDGPTLVYARQTRHERQPARNLWAVEGRVSCKKTLPPRLINAYPTLDMMGIIPNRHVAIANRRTRNGRGDREKYRSSTISSKNTGTSCASTRANRFVYGRSSYPVPMAVALHPEFG